MCGIAGFVHLDQPAQSSLVHAMCDQIRHRGPDDEGVHVDRGCGIGMRRLSIIDLSTGHQPMSNKDGSVWIVFNGEIYQYQELRASLMARQVRLPVYALGGMDARNAQRLIGTPFVGIAAIGALAS